VALAVIVFLPTVNFRFVNWDDDFHVYRSPVVTGDGDVGLRDVLLTPHLGYPVPVTVASYRLDHRLHGLAPAGYHITNLVLHALATGLVFLLALALRLRLLGAVAAAVLFAIHPAVAEPVSWISGRKDLLATLFALASLLVHLRSPFQLRRPATYAASVLFGLAVFAKPSVVLVPLVAVLADRVANRAEWRRAVAAALPMLVIAGVALVLGALGQQKVGALADSGSGWGWLRNIWYALGHQAAVLALTIAPSPKYVFAEMPPAFSPLVDLLPLALAALAVASCFAFREGRSIVAFGWAFAALAYLPSSGIVPLVRFVADSYLYLALVGLGLVVGVALERLAERGRHFRLVPWAIVIAAVAMLLPRTMDASSHWRDGSSLWQSVYRVYPTSPEVCRNLGNAYAEEGKPRDALAQYLECADKFGRELVAKNVGIVLMQMGQRDQARAILLEAAAYAPDDPVIRRYLDELSEP